VRKDLIQHGDDLARFRGEDLFQVGKRASAMGQAVAPDQRVVIVPLIGRQGIRHHDWFLPPRFPPCQ
jgi:hypothetical protein